MTVGMIVKELSDRLSAPFKPSEIEWRISHTAKQDTCALVLAYVTARAVMERLDEVFGPLGWSSMFEPVAVGGEQGLLCTLTVRMVPDAGLGLLRAGESTFDGISRSVSDVCPCSDIEPLKGAASGALKRAAVHLGIGRYLYDLGDTWVDLYTEAQKQKGTKYRYHKCKDGSARYWVEPGPTAAVLVTAPPTPWPAKHPNEDLHPTAADIDALRELLMAAGMSFTKDPAAINDLLLEFFGVAKWGDLPKMSRERFGSGLGVMRLQRFQQSSKTK